jgi:hypothetical protein
MKRENKPLYLIKYNIKQKGPGEPWGIQIGYITPLGEQIQIHIFYLLITVSIAEQNNQTVNKHI